ncbi:zinc finger, CCHC-type containing protein [Tanacetum coccineum]
MGDENPIHTLGDYSRPSHEGFRITIEIPDGNNVVPLRSDTIRLVQNECSFHGLRSEDPNQHLNDFLKLVDSLDLNVENRERTHLRSISTWEDLITRFLAQFFPPGRTAKLRNDILMFQQHQVKYVDEDRLRKMSTEKAWNTIKDLARYEEEGWNDPIFPEEGSLNYKNANIIQLLGVMECQGDPLMKNAISLMGRSENVCGMTSNMMCQLSSDPSRQEAFKDLMINFILDQEEKVRQLEEYMCLLQGSDDPCARYLLVMAINIGLRMVLLDSCHCSGCIVVASKNVVTGLLDIAMADLRVRLQRCAFIRVSIAFGNDQRMENAVSSKARLPLDTRVDFSNDLDQRTLMAGNINLSFSGTLEMRFHVHMIDWEKTCVLLKWANENPNAYKRALVPNDSSKSTPSS